MDFYKIYKPITAAPFAHGPDYMEFEPCDALKPFIRCFWGSSKPYIQPETDIPTQGLVTPDTCMDIIFDVNFTENTLKGSFCGIDDSSFFTSRINDRRMELSTFAIRFYAWSAVPFSEESMKDVKNGFFNVDYHFSRLRKELYPLLFDIINIEDRIAITERFLLQNIRPEKSSPVVMEVVYEILRRKGNIRIEQLSRDIHISGRHLERIFRENIGVSPKKFSSLIRYQYLWHDMLFRKDFNVLDAVYELGYTDQAHLVNDFRQFHTMSPQEAKGFAMKDILQKTDVKK